MLNITNDHLEIYNNIENYINSKFRIAFFQTYKDIFIYNYDDLIIRKKIKQFKILSKCIPFSIKQKLNFGAYIENDNIFYKNHKQRKFFCVNIKNIQLIGEHNIYNVMCSCIVSKILKINNISILHKITPIVHRMEKVLSINGVQFINDSKATNVNAVFYALKSFSLNRKSIIWIAGGKDKGNDYKELIYFVKKNVKAIICLGKDNKKIINFFKKIIPIMIETKNIKKAVFLSYIYSSPGDYVLFSPACSSFDLFKNYKERGNKFKKVVKELFFKI